MMRALLVTLALLPLGTQDIGGWAVHSVTDMEGMFWGASSFNEDISGWAVDSVTIMSWMFYNASAFDQDLGWCVDDGTKKIRHALTTTNTLVPSKQIGLRRLERRIARRRRDRCAARRRPAGLRGAPR